MAGLGQRPQRRGLTPGRSDRAAAAGRGARSTSATGPSLLTTSGQGYGAIFSTKTTDRRQTHALSRQTLQRRRMRWRWRREPATCTALYVTPRSCASGGPSPRAGTAISVSGTCLRLLFFLQVTSPGSLLISVGGARCTPPEGRIIGAENGANHGVEHKADQLVWQMIWAASVAAGRPIQRLVWRLIMMAAATADFSGLCGSG